MCATNSGIELSVPVSDHPLVQTNVGPCGVHPACGTAAPLKNQPQKAVQPASITVSSPEAAQDTSAGRHRCAAPSLVMNLEDRGARRAFRHPVLESAAASVSK